MQRILGLLNQSNSLEHIVRLSNIETEDDLNRCIADQYAVAFTKAQLGGTLPEDSTGKCRLRTGNTECEWLNVLRP